MIHPSRILRITMNRQSNVQSLNSKYFVTSLNHRPKIIRGFLIYSCSKVNRMIIATIVVLRINNQDKDYWRLDGYLPRQETLFCYNKETDQLVYDGLFLLTRYRTNQRTSLSEFPVIYARDISFISFDGLNFIL